VTIVEARACRHLNDRDAAWSQHAKAMSDGKVIAFNMFEHVQENDGIERTRRKRTLRGSARDHQNDLRYLPENHA
jgi:hypothetical protein